ncbi:LysR family transcriptional regulator [Actinoallomurus iriomotensis]|uniref:LysR family transcriptional regulator n=1 Tax=Actinoallomurus iriomotensis TaxID=478107 RepID=A0A9W6S9P2_9ACTN|nr:LysR family transcriptional regulator [Actinoallomurus iriomotensis]
MLDARRLRVLLAVAAQGSFSAAARALSYSQPAVSQHVAALEQELGVRLVERDRRRVRFTEAGQALVRRAETIIDELDLAEAEVRAVADGRAGRVRIATFASAAYTLVPAVISLLRTRHPDVEPVLSLAELPAEAIGAVRSWHADLALTVGQEPATDLRTDVLFDDPLRVVLPRHDPLAAATAVRLSDLADRPWVIGGGPECPDAALILAACRGRGFDPRVALSFPTDDYTAVQGMVAAGVGVALLPDLALGVSHRGVTVRPLAGEDAVTRTVFAVTRSDPREIIGRLAGILREAHAAASGGATVVEEESAVLSPLQVVQPPLLEDVAVEHPASAPDHRGGHDQP